VFGHFADAALVSISDNQRRLLPHWNWLGTVYNGLDLDGFTLHPHAGSYLAFLGRISPEKGLEDAIAVAKLTGLPLKIAAKLDPADVQYYESRVRPLLDNSRIEYVGEITEQEKESFLGHALALLFPICWPEPFGLVMVEAMAAGCPVIASRRGSVPEVLTDGITGFVCDSVQEMALACTQVPQLNRAACRARAVEQFSAARMADGYETLYHRLTRAHDLPTFAPLPLVAAEKNGHHPQEAINGFRPGAAG
jgi:glycosyltransferase involved in cell wall biosynthesis